MKVIRYPEKAVWQEILARPAFETKSLEHHVQRILDFVKRDGDEAVRHYTKTLDRADVEDFAVSAAEFGAAESRVSEELKNAINHAKSNLEKFHEAQKEEVKIIETTPGVFCWRKSVAIERVGLYVPSGSAPLFSTVLMLGVPARIAGCREIVLCSPPDETGAVADAILYAAKLLGIEKVFKIGGAQAIGAMAFGTESVSRVYKIFGPGNQFVTCAKQLVARTGIAVDMPAGPTEVAVLADESCVASFVAADLLSQAEHGTDSQVLLVSTSEAVIAETNIELDKQLAKLSRRDIAAKALENSKAILVKNADEAVEILNEYAAEHLVIAAENADELAEKIESAGSVFIGNYSCESAGDYAAGTNHTLPTGGFARSYSGVSLDSFVKKITFQKLTADGIKNLGPTIETMAQAEGLDAHKNAISIRLESFK
jgi:histidinol dehydrogenase